ncbi:unnamed protein product [Urochloa decumbens]|uniref:KIB1-4 beta-propeller domain-containing protein n=1 Tax=Urochloa decumbens TaxID=240449 RepID=A0ABC8VA68_9POAL
MSSHAPSKCRVQWCELQADLCGNIIDRMDALDVLNFEATCRSWSFVCSHHLQSTLLKSGAPTLLTSRPDLDGTRVEETLGEGAFGLHDISQGSSFCVYNESLKHGSWVGGKDDWVVITDNRCSMNLVNPITGYKIPLPSLSTIDGLQINGYEDLELDSLVCSRTLRRVALCNTPSSSTGYFALVLFDDGMLAYTSKGDNNWKLFKHPRAYQMCHHYDPQIYMDALLYKGSVVAVDDGGYMFSWDITSPEKDPLGMPSPENDRIEGCTGCVFYLAKSPADELLLIGVQGHCHRAPSSGRVLVSEHDVFKHIDGVTLHKFDYTHGTWERSHTIGLGQSLFLGLNYPFYGSWSGIKRNSLYVADMGGKDVLTFELKDEGEAIIERHDFPREEAVRLLDGHSMRTPMWFRPTLPSKSKDK